MSEARINRISNELGTGGPIVSGITTFSGLNYFVPPKGTTAERPSNCPSGSIRFNTDSAHLEYFDGLQWLEFEAFNNELGVSGALGNRGLFSSGYIPGSPATYVNTIEYLTISTLGNTIDFGDLTAFRACLRACSNQVRAVFGGGYFTPSTTASGGTADNRIDYITISSAGNAQDFGDLSSGSIHSRGAALSDSHGGLGGF